MIDVFDAFRAGNRYVKHERYVCGRVPGSAFQASAARIEIHSFRDIAGHLGIVPFFQPQHEITIREFTAYDVRKTYVTVCRRKVPGTETEQCSHNQYD